ncbi:hypothetical protein MauCBS54593_007263 [Microsporum audouinii]
MTPSRDKNERPIIEMESKIPLDCPILVPKSTFIEGNIPRPQKFAYMLSWAIEIWGENLMTVTVDGESSTKEPQAKNNPDKPSEPKKDDSKA